MYQYNKQLNNSETNYFIVDSSSSAEHNDVDFKFYSYQNKSNKQITTGDLFIYRRSGSASEWGNEFYLYGAGEFGEVAGEDPETGSNLVTIKNPYLFSHHLMKQNLQTFDWKFRKFKGKWSNFFNMNGITQISKADFVGLLERQKNMVPDEPELSPEEESIAVKCYQAEKMESYFINDEVKGISTFNAVNKFFSDKVKFNNHYKSVLVANQDESELIATRIVPWDDDKNTRLDARNGICLSKLFSEAFTKGYFTFTDQGHIIVSDTASSNPEINQLLDKYKSRKIYMNKEYSPNKNYLRYHREHIFKQ